MTAIGSTAFAAVLWSAVLGVALVFVYEAYALVRDSRGGTR